jgi:hypothetical protein
MTMGRNMVYLTFNSLTYVSQPWVASKPSIKPPLPPQPSEARLAYQVAARLPPNRRTYIATRTPLPPNQIYQVPIYPISDRTNEF